MQFAERPEFLVTSDRTRGVQTKLPEKSNQDSAGHGGPEVVYYKGDQRGSQHNKTG